MVLSAIVEAVDGATLLRERIGRVFDDTNIGIANARLIAAAPALADVARTASTLAEFIRRELILAGFSGPSISDLRDLADAATAAIAQAEGGAK